MTIYIYGSKDFKNNIQEVLERANMKFRLNEDDSIVELASVQELKDAIEEEPKDIFLIDDEKIIRKNGLNNKIKFLKPKDGIEEEFLKEHGIGDLSVDDISDIATHVIRKLKKAHALKEEQKELNQEKYIEKQNNEIASKNNEYEFVHGNQKQKQTNEFHEDEDLFESYSSSNNLEDAHIQDEEHDDEHEFNIDDVIDFGDENEEKNEEESQWDNPKEDSTQEMVEEDYDSRIENLQEEDFGLTVEKIDQKRESDMSDEFSELDSLNEDELLEALGGSSIKSESTQKSQNNIKKSGAEVELNSSSIHDISSLITQLLNNKTLEITIKIKE